ncbi:MAG: hypothetical protein Q9164_006842, partial [Protoblastenia rupestris]
MPRVSIMKGARNLTLAEYTQRVTTLLQQSLKRQLSEDNGSQTPAMDAYQELAELCSLSSPSATNNNNDSGYTSRTSPPSQGQWPGRTITVCGCTSEARHPPSGCRGATVIPVPAYIRPDDDSPNPNVNANDDARTQTSRHNLRSSQRKRQSLVLHPPNPNNPVNKRRSHRIKKKPTCRLRLTLGPPRRRHYSLILHPPRLTQFTLATQEKDAKDVAIPDHQ